MNKKPKIALYWCAGCGGCEESVIDLAEELLTVSRLAEIVFWPVAMDTRYSDIDALNDGAIDAVFINGAVRTDEQLNMARLLRRKARRVVAHGACAHLGGVLGLANLFDSEQLIDCAYRQVPSMADLPRTSPGKAKDGPPVPSLLPSVQPLGHVVPIDAVIPGCPPPTATMREAIMDAIQGKMPKGAKTVYAHQRSLCHECPRLDSKPDRLEISRFKRLHETLWDATRCFLPQGLICLGPATRGGCSARCINANMPCRGCFGPTDQVDDFGAGAVGFIAAMLPGSDEDSLAQSIDSLVDATGLIYRYSMAASVAGRGRPS